MDPNTWTFIEEIFRDLLIFVVAMTGLLIALVVIVSFLPPENPLKRVLSALSYRVGATAAVGALAIPLEPIPGLDVMYDVGAPILLLWYWYNSSETFAQDGCATSIPCLNVRSAEST